MFTKRLHLLLAAGALGAAILVLGQQPSAEARSLADSLRKDCYGLVPTISGTELANNIVGTPDDDIIQGLGGDDTIDGGGGNDTICGGLGNDTIYGGPGADLIAGDFIAGTETA